MTDNDQQSLIRTVSWHPRESSRALTLIDRVGDITAFVTGFGKALWQSGMFGLTSHEAGAVMALAMLTENLSPFEIKRRYHIIHNNLTMRADAMLAEFRSRLHGDHEVLECTPERAEIELWLPNRKHHRAALEWKQLLAGREPFLFQKDGKTLKDNWATPWMREQMLWARVVSASVRKVAPEIVAGVYTPEEVGDDVMEGEVVGAPVAPAASNWAYDPRKADLSPPEDAGVEPAAEPPPFDEPKPAGDLPKVSKGQLEEMLRLVKELALPTDGWKKLIGQYGVTTAKDLSFDEADAVIGSLIEAQRKRGDRDALSTWAETALAGAGDAPEADVGNA